MIRTFKAVTSLLTLAFALSACNGTDYTGGYTGPTVTSASVNADDINNPDSNNNGCLSATVSHFTTWTLNYSDGTSNNGATLRYFSPHTNQNSTIAVDTGFVDQNMKQWNSAAISVWSNTLASRVATGHYYSLLPQEVNNSNAMVRMFSTSDDPGFPAGTGLGATSDGQYIGAASVYFYSEIENSGNYNGKYAAALHEIGHAMALSHNPDGGSIMNPYVDLENNFADTCYSYNASNGANSTPPINNDTKALEQAYDPVFKDPSGDPKCGGGHTCAQTVMALGKQQTAFLSKAQNGIDLESIEQHRAFLRSLVWFHAEDPLNARNLSSEALTLISPLIVQSKIGQRVGMINVGGERYEVFSVKVSKVLRHLFGPELKVKDGMSILVADKAPIDGNEWSDDPLPKPGTTPILFLKRSNSKALKTAFGTVYVPAAPFVSKWLIDSRLRIHVQGPVDSVVRREMEGETAASIALRLRNRYGTRALVDEETCLRSLLATYGVSSNSDISKYAVDLTQNQSRLIRRFARRSQALARHQM